MSENSENDLLVGSFSLKCIDKKEISPSNTENLAAVSRAKWHLSVF